LNSLNDLNGIAIKTFDNSIDLLRCYCCCDRERVLAQRTAFRGAATSSLRAANRASPRRHPARRHTLPTALRSSSTFVNRSVILILVKPPKEVVVYLIIGGLVFIKQTKVPQILPMSGIGVRIELLVDLRHGPRCGFENLIIRVQPSQSGHVVANLTIVSNGIAILKSLP
jgi:hypothetical protein